MVGLFLPEVVMSNLIGPMSAQRHEVFAQTLQEIALKLQKELTDSSKKMVIHFYRIGAMVDDVLNDSSNYYGANAIAKLETFLNVRAATLRDYRNFARAFPDHQYVVEQQGKLTSTGQTLTVYHWIYAARLEDPLAQKSMIERAIRDGLSANEVLEVISGALDRSGGSSNAGRPVRRPTSPVAGVTKIGKLAAKFGNYMDEVADQYIFNPLDAISPDVVTNNLDSILQETGARLQDMLLAAQTAVSRLDEIKKRVSRIIAAKDTQVDPAAGVEVEREYTTPVSRTEQMTEPTGFVRNTEPPARKRGRPAKKTPTGI
jgi:hypothetical protein